MRFALATTVVWSHSFELLGQSPTGWWHGFNLGVVAVNGFFLLSGYLITQSWNRDPRLLDFVSKRVRRIYPGFLVAILLSLVVFGPLGASNRPVYWASLKVGPLLVSAATLTSPKTAAVFPAIQAQLVNGALWTIRYEFLCYGLVGACGVLGLLTRRWVILALTVVAWTLYATEQWVGPWAWGGRLDSLMIPMPRLATFYLAGCCFALYGSRRTFQSIWVSLGAMVGLVAVYAIEPAVGQAILPLLGGYLLFAAAFAPTGSVGPLTNEWPDFTYGLYLYAWPVEMLVLQSAPTTPPILVFVATMGGAILLGLASWYAIERPATRRRTSRLPGTRTDQDQLARTSPCFP